MAEYGDEFAVTIRERLHNDMSRTLDGHGIGTHLFDEDEEGMFSRMLDDLVADAMHPIEQLIATLRKRATEDNDSAAERRRAEIASHL